ncbi:MAG: TetR/AcrR family transcriptional regulator [Gammaproteobacteria bacterium]|nr:TetR/AcrR family transcriptional regulator [Gammaproteobacteria bacterium]
MINASTRRRPAPGRPKSVQKASAILSAAGDLFLAHGYGKTSMDAVAERAGVSKQTVYSHFPGKEELFRAVIIAKLEDYEFSESGMPDEDDPERGLLRIAERFLALLLDAEVIAMHRVVIGESAGHPEVARIFAETGPDGCRNSLKRYLQRQADSGRLAIDDADHAASQFLAMAMSHYQVRSLLNLDPGLTRTARRRHIKRTVADFLLLYRARRGTRPRTSASA